MKIKRSKRKRVVMVLAVIFAVILGLNVVGFAVNSVLSKGELEQVVPYGQLVEVNGGRMHVYALGDGEQTVVLLPGFGVSLPSADFGPLMRELSEKYTVVTVEYFGVGFSDAATTPRTHENYVSEVREVLDKAGFAPPYILMPHSASGIYSEFYASKYPEEVSALILLDSTTTALNEKMPEKMPWYMRAAYKLGKVQQAVGMTRLTYRLVPETKLPRNGYTSQEVDDYRLFTYHVLNDTIIEQSMLMVESMSAVNKMPFPESIPVMKIISQDTMDRMSKKDPEAGMDYHHKHLARLGSHAVYRVLEGTHFLYQTHAGEIAALAEAFLQEQLIEQD